MGQGEILRSVAYAMAILGAAIGSAQGAATNAPVLTPPDVGYSVEHWTVEDGLPGRIVTALAQTPDGALWGGTSEELVRFDGVRFTSFNARQVPALSGVVALELRSDQAGRLWILGINGALVLYENGRFRRLSERDGMPLNQGGKFGETVDQDLWVKGRTDNRFYRYRTGHFAAVTYAGTPGAIIDRFLSDASGVRWGVHEQNRTMVQFSGQGEFQSLVAPDGISRVLAGRFFRLQDGRWAVTSTHGIYVIEGTQWTLHHGFTRPLEGAVLDGVEDWAGNFWASVYDQGLVLSSPNRSTTKVSLPNLGARPFLRAMLLGREGNVWIGGNDGLYRLRRHPFQVQPPQGESHQESAAAILEAKDGAIWILNRDGWTRPTKTGWDFTRHPYAQAYLWTGCASRDGSVILGYTERGDTDAGFLDKQFSDGRTQRLGNLRGVIRVMLESRAGNLWVGTDAGLWHWDGENLTSVQLPMVAGAFGVRGLAEDALGQLYASLYDHGLWTCSSNGSWQRLTTASDPASGEIWGLDADPDGTIWAATDAGLARWRNGRWHSYGTMGGELPQLARSVVRDNQEGLWIASQFGVVRVDVSALNTAAEQAGVTLGSDWFDRSDGLPSVSSSDEQATLCQATDGRVWVGTLKGAALVDPKEWQNQRRLVGPPSVAIETVLVDEEPMPHASRPNAPGTRAETFIRPGARRVEFHYNVIDLTPNQKTRVRYRLDGFDPEWMNATEQREALYHHLPPGNYRFQVMAANKYGLWTTAGASTAIVVEPFYWQTTWFKVGAGVISIGILSLAYVLKLRQLRREQERREAFALGLIQSQEVERKRIAQELHDSLGQDLILIKNAATLTLRKFNPVPPVSDYLNEMATLAAHALTNARHITSNLRPPELDRLGLTAALETVIEKLAAHSDIKLTAAIENVNGLWSADQEIHIYRIVQEGLNNALKHASPRHIQLSVRRDIQAATIMLNDDGCGFDPEAAVGPRAGIGLAGLKERIRILGGEMTLHSSRGKGTTVHCRIPVSAYGKDK